MSTIRLSPHTGTHVDAPRHLLDAAPGVGELPLEAFIGPAVVLDAPGAAIDAEFLAGALTGNPDPERVLFRTGAWIHPDAFPRTFPAISREAVEMLRSAGVRLVGTDAPSVDSFDSTDLPAHHALVTAGIAILENLDLSEVPAGRFELIALPLMFAGLDASPVRAVLRRVEAEKVS